MTGQALWGSVKRRDSKEPEMGKKTDTDAIEMCAVEGKHGGVRSPVVLAIRSVAGDVLEDEIVADHMQKAAMRVVVLLHED